MSSPVHVGTATAVVSWRHWSVYCQGIRSSIQASVYGSRARPIRMHESSAMCPKWSAAIATS